MTLKNKTALHPVYFLSNGWQAAHIVLDIEEIEFFLAHGFVVKHGRWYFMR